VRYATSTITGRTGAQEDARAFGSAGRVSALAQALAQAGAGLAPGSGEYLSAQDSRQQMNQALQQYMGGNYGDAAGQFGGSLVSAAGAVPFAGLLARLLRRGDDAGKTVQELRRLGVNVSPEWVRQEPPQLTQNQQLRQVLQSVRQQPNPVDLWLRGGK
jgi:hypothetical protein